ncbi:SDR family NAD(P)-dependent oxidoreductase [Fusobacterium sp. PH5-44]|uniref:SDR family NAD(P)-dependent oxidoreductase n=1 Tax=unclassified Fusobacterium TaxID=2648384 RepID=UPI003D1E8A4B
MKVFICGGTSGIGLALAKKYLDKDYEVGICGRTKEKIDSIEKHPNLSVYQVDVCDKLMLSKKVSDFSQGNLDIIIAMAGSYANDRTNPYTKEQVSSMLKTNIAGTINALESAREIMLTNNRGHMVVMSSVAALLNYEGASVYSRCKKVVMELGNAYRTALSSFGINVTTIISGYVDTLKLRELNDNDLSKKLFIISEDEAADRIIKAIDDNRNQVIFPKKMKILMNFLSIIPNVILKKLLLKRNSRGNL